MQMFYNSDSFAVVQIDWTGAGADSEAKPVEVRGGFEIVDKFARKEIFLDGALARRFHDGVQSLIQSGPTQEEMDDYIGGFAAAAQQPVVMH